MRTRPTRRRSRRRSAWTPRSPSGRGRACVAKLERAPVEDLRVDFEDGYGARPDDEEDRHAEEAARAVQTARTDGTAPPSFGLRVKSFADGAEARSLRTLDTFVTTLTEAAGGLPDGFVVTFPKVTTPDHVALFAEALERLEVGLGLDERALRFEVQVETPRSVIGPDGSVAAPRILDAADGRLTAMHFGVFDYTASLGLMPWEQRLDHPANDLARELLQVALAGTGVRSERRFEQRRAGERPHRGRARRVAGARRPRSALALRAASTRAGTCTPRTSRAGTPPSTGGCSRTWTTRPRACARGGRGPPRRGCSTSRRRSRACCGTCGSRSPPAPWTRPRSSRRPGSRGTSCSGAA